MSGGSRLAGRALAKQFPWQSYNTVIDVGSAQGCVAVELAKAHRHLSGGGFDLEELRDPFESYVRSCGFDDRLKFFSGNFFADPLPTADVLILGRILHDWSVPQRELLLKKAHAALSDNGALIVYEAFIDDFAAQTWRPALQPQHAVADHRWVRVHDARMQGIDARRGLWRHARHPLDGHSHSSGWNEET